MSILSAENSFRKGLAALVDERFVEAAAFFLTALEIDEHRKGEREPRYLSYYGLSLAKAHGVSDEALEACEHAALRDERDPALLLNLGRVHAMDGRLARAADCFRRGLALDPDNAALARELARAAAGLADRSGRSWRTRWIAGLSGVVRGRRASPTL